MNAKGKENNSKNKLFFQEVNEARKRIKRGQYYTEKEAKKALSV